MSIKIIDPLEQFQISSNHLGDIYQIPNHVGFKLDLDLIMSVYIHCEIKYTHSYVEIIVIHQGSLSSHIK